MVMRRGNVKVLEIPGSEMPIEAVPTSIASALVHSDFGIEGNPLLVTSGAQLLKNIGDLRSDSYCNYLIEQMFDEAGGAGAIYLSRECGAAARFAKGCSGVKILPIAAYDMHLTGDDAVIVTADEGGPDGTSISWQIITNTSDVLVVELDGTSNILVKLASITPALNTATLVAAAINAEVDCAALVTASLPGAGSGTVTEMAKTYLAGDGEVTGAAANFTDSDAEFVTKKVFPGDVLVILTGPNIGAYIITQVTSETVVVVDENFGTTDTTCIYAIYGQGDGTTNYLGFGVRAVSLHKGEKSKNINLAFAKSNDELNVDIEITRTDGEVELDLEEHEDLNPIYGETDYLDTYMAQESDWITLDCWPEKIISHGEDGVQAATTYTSAGANFVGDGVAAGDVLYIHSTTGGDIGSAVVVSVTNLTTLVVDRTLGTSTADTYDIVARDTVGTVLLDYLGASGKAVPLYGGVDDAPISTDIIGVEGNKTGLYALDDVDDASILMLPDAAITVDGIPADATKEVHSAALAYCEGREDMLYVFNSELGNTPAEAITEMRDTWGFNSKFGACYYPWIKVTDRLTGTQKLVPPCGAAVGIFIRTDNGPEGVHKAPANEIVRTAQDLEYTMNMTENDLLRAKGINGILPLDGLRIYGARTIWRGADEWKWIHKRRTYIMIAKSLLIGFADFPFKVQGPQNWNRAIRRTTAFLKQFDRRTVRNGALLNRTDAAADPWDITCDASLNPAGSTKMKLRLLLSIVDTIEDVVIEIATWKGGATVTEA